MTIEEAREILGYKKDDVVVKAGLWEYQKAYKAWLKDTNISKVVRQSVERDLSAVEVLLKA